MRAVSDLNFEIEAGELVGFLGPNGAGKTTTLKMLSGLLHPTSGNLQVLGFIPYDRKTEFQKQISLVMGQRSQLWWELPAQETLKLNQKIYEIPEAQYERNLGELVELLDLKNLLNVPVKKLSLGQRMKAELCASLLHHPRLLLLDEPTLGLDVVMQKRIREFIREYNIKHGATILLTSHNMDDVVELCPRVLIIDEGKLLYDGSLKKVVNSYAPNKVLTVDLAEPTPLGRLESIGRILSNGISGPTLHVKLEVPRKEVSKKAAELLSRFPVLDLTIEETPMDEIIRHIFTSHSAR